MRICKRLLATVLGLVFAASPAHAQTAEIAATVTDQQGRPVVDAVLVAVPVDGDMRSPQRPRPGSIDQVDKEFLPRVTIVPVGASVTFPNHDDVRHQVYSFSPAKRFEFPLPNRGCVDGEAQAGSARASGTDCRARRNKILKRAGVVAPVKD